MIEHTVHWPALGIDGEESEEETEIRRLMEESRRFRQFIWVVHLTTALVYLMVVGVIALGLVNILAKLTGTSVVGPSLVWAFAGAIALIMIADEMLPVGAHSAIRYTVGFVISHSAIWVIRGVYVVQRRRSGVNPSVNLENAVDRELLPQAGVEKGKQRFD